jgi:3-oxoacyl-[acyl-carrier protein] reductase
MDQLKDKVAIVTGASRGIGRSIAQEFAREGAAVALCARAQSTTPLPGTIYETAQVIQASGGEALPLACDVTQEAEVQSLVEQVVARYGQIDVLVNNAGIMILGESFLDIEPERWDQIVAVNIRGPYLMCRHVLPVMIRQGRGSVVSIGSLAGSESRPAGAAYCTTKAGLHMLTRCIAEDVREHHIAVNIFNPGSVKTEGSSIIPWAQNDWDQRTTPEEAGPPAVYLARQTAETMTGQLVNYAEFGKTWGL